MKTRFLAKWTGVRLITEVSGNEWLENFESCCGLLMRRNSVLVGFKTSRFPDIQLYRIDKNRWYIPFDTQPDDESVLTIVRYSECSANWWPVYRPIIGFRRPVHLSTRQTCVDGWCAVRKRYWRPVHLFARCTGDGVPVWAGASSGHAGLCDRGFRC